MVRGNRLCWSDTKRKAGLAMAVVSLTDLKAKASEYVARAERGEQVLITRRGKIVAVLNPPPELSREERDRAHLEELARKGLVRLGTGRWDAFLKQPKVKLETNALVEAVLAEREESPW